MAEAQKNDSGKVRLELHPFDVLESVGWVWTKGAKKYEERNWEWGFDWSRVFGAVLRHLFAWGSGRRVDPEWGYSHLDHALCSLMMLRAHELRGLGKDDMGGDDMGVAPQTQWKAGDMAVLGGTYGKLVCKLIEPSSQGWVVSLPWGAHACAEEAALSPMPE